MGGDSLLGYFVHSLASYLYLYPLAALAHKGGVQGAVSVGAGFVEPVAQTVGVGVVDAGDGVVYLEALVVLVVNVFWGEDYSYGKNVVYVLECDVLFLHFIPDGVGRFYAAYYVEFAPHFLEAVAYGGGKFGVEHVARLLGLFYLFFYFGILLGVLVAETQIFELGLYFAQPQTVSDGGVYVECLAGYLVLFVDGHKFEGAHIVQTVGYLDEYHANIFAHRKEQFLEILGLLRCLHSKYSARDFCQPIDYHCYLLAKEVAYVLDGVVGILDYVVQQGGAY